MPGLARLRAFAVSSPSNPPPMMTAEATCGVLSRIFFASSSVRSVMPHFFGSPWTGGEKLLAPIASTSRSYGCHVPAASTAFFAMSILSTLVERRTSRRLAAYHSGLFMNSFSSGTAPAMNSMSIGLG